MIAIPGGNKVIRGLIDRSERGGEREGEGEWRGAGLYRMNDLKMCATEFTLRGDNVIRCLIS